MKTTIQDQMVGLIQMKSMVLARARLLPDPSKHLHISSSDDGCQSIKKYNGKDWNMNRINKSGRKTNNIIHALREHVKLGGKISETVKGKLSLGARIVKVGGLKKIYKKLFTINKDDDDDKLLKASQCYLSTTAGPLLGLLFISTHQIAFCSHKSIKLSPPNHQHQHHHTRFHYKVRIPVEKIEGVYESENVKNSSEKYMEIVTVDGFEFWFMGFFNYHKSFNSLQQALSQS